MYFLNDKKYFEDMILSNKDFNYDNLYIVLIKVRTVSGNYFTITKQQFFLIPNSNNDNYLDKLWFKLIDALEFNLDYYFKVIQEDVAVINLEF